MILEDKKIGEYVVSDYRSAHVFSKYGIDFCCGGQRSLKDVCDKNLVDFQKVLEELLQLEKDGDPIRIVEDSNIEELIDYILEKHHTYTREKGHLLLEYSNKMLNAHGEKHPEVKIFHKLVTELVNDLLQHLMKEENILFPAILSLDNPSNNLFKGDGIMHPISAMEFEHDIAGKILGDLSSLTNNFEPPSYACTTWKICYKTLSAYADDLKTHIHLENNILFPTVRQGLN